MCCGAAAHPIKQNASFSVSDLRHIMAIPSRRFDWTHRAFVACRNLSQKLGVSLVTAAYLANQTESFQRGVGTRWIRPRGRVLIRRVPAFSSMSRSFVCPICGSQAFFRVRRRGIIDWLRCHIWGKWPYLCDACGRKSYRIQRHGSPAASRP
jgi:hypothetical protein